MFWGPGGAPESPWSPFAAGTLQAFNFDPCWLRLESQKHGLGPLAVPISYPHKQPLLAFRIPKSNLPAIREDASESTCGACMHSKTLTWTTSSIADQKKRGGGCLAAWRLGLRSTLCVKQRTCRSRLVRSLCDTSRRHQREGYDHPIQRQSI